MIDTTRVLEWSAESLRVALYLAGPPLLVALLVGLALGVVQTLTQMHEPVVGQVPRLVAVLLATLAVLPWMIGTWLAFAAEMLGGY